MLSALLVMSICMGQAREEKYRHRPQYSQLSTVKTESLSNRNKKIKEMKRFEILHLVSHTIEFHLNKNLILTLKTKQQSNRIDESWPKFPREKRKLRNYGPPDFSSLPIRPRFNVCALRSYLLF